MNATDLLMDQHQEVSSLFGQYEAEEDVAAKRRLFVEIADALSAHTTVEERIFYPGIRTPATAAILDKSADDHLEVKRLIADLLDLHPRDPEFGRKISLLESNVDAHVLIEEAELFPLVQKNFRPQELEAMGRKMEQMFEQLAQEEAGTGVPHPDQPTTTE